MSELWVDTDLGFDDLHAMLVLRCHQVRPVAYSLVFGCATLDQVISNAQGIEEAFSLGGAWFCGAANALDGQCRTAEHILGRTGMQSRGLALAQSDRQSRSQSRKPPLQEASASDGMINWLSGNPAEPQVLALGPLTNLAQLIIEAPELAAKLTRITWMGGSTGRGNQTEYAEFNAWADPEAAAIVMQSGIHVHLVELETCRKLQVVTEDLQRLSSLTSPRADLLHDLLGGYLDIGLSRGRKGMAMYDPLAAAAVVMAQASATAHGGNILGSTAVRISVETVDKQQAGRTDIVTADKTTATERSNISHSLCVVNDVKAVHQMLIDALIQTATDVSLDY